MIHEHTVDNLSLLSDKAVLTNARLLHRHLLPQLYSNVNEAIWTDPLKVEETQMLSSTTWYTVTGGLVPSSTKVWLKNNLTTFILEPARSEDDGVLTIEKLAVLLGIW